MTEDEVRKTFAAVGGGPLTGREFELAYRAQPFARPPYYGWAPDPSLAGAGRLKTWVRRGVVVVDQSGRTAARYRLAETQVE